MFTRFMSEIANRATILMYEPTPVPTSDVWAPVNNLKDVLLAGMASVGVIVLIIAIVQFATSFVSHDNSQKINAIFIFLVGAMFIGASALLGTIIGT